MRLGSKSQRKSKKYSRNSQKSLTQIKDEPAAFDFLSFIILRCLFVLKHSMIAGYCGMSCRDVNTSSNGKPSEKPEWSRLKIFDIVDDLPVFEDFEAVGLRWGWSAPLGN
jgi:hypothetical protein